jgi:hypothetical protein
MSAPLLTFASRGAPMGVCAATNGRMAFSALEFDATGGCDLPAVASSAGFVEATERQVDP